MAVNLKLRALRIGEGMNQKDMCTLLGLKAESSYSQKETGKRAFAQEEIEIISNRFNLSGEQLKDIFFNSKLYTNGNSKSKPYTSSLSGKEIVDHDK